jgi:hypothetical protein
MHMHEVGGTFKITRVVAHSAHEGVEKGKTGLTLGLTIGLLAALFVACAPHAFALPTSSDNLGVADTCGDQDTYVVVPVTISNVQDGAIISIIFDIVYNNNVIAVVGVQNGNLTSSWDVPAFKNDFAWGTRVSLVYDGQTAHGLQDGSTGSIILLNLRVNGESCETSRMDLTNIQFSDTTYRLGTAPAKNGTFTIRTESGISMLTDTVEDVKTSEAYGE